MIDFATVVGGARYGDDVETQRHADMVELHKGVGDDDERTALAVVDRLLRLHKDIVAAGFHLYEHHRSAVDGNDVEVAAVQTPVALYDVVALAFQIVGGFLLAPLSKFVVCSHGIDDDW